MFGTILSGASAVAPFAHAAFGLIAAALAAADIALDLTGRAQVHGDMVRKYLQLVADLASADWDPDKVTKIRATGFRYRLRSRRSIATPSSLPTTRRSNR